MDEKGAGSTNTNNGVKPLDFLKEVLQVVEWINKVDGKDKRDSNAHSSLSVRLEEKFNTAYARIKELEGQLSEVEGENGELKEKLNEMELLAGYHQVELIRLTAELETEKWERFDAESRLKKMMKEVAELHESVGELVSNLQEDKQGVTIPAIMAHASNQPTIKREPEEESEEALLGDDMEKREDLRNMFVDLSSQVNERLQKFEDMQAGTTAELNGLIQGLVSLQTLISHKETTRKKSIISKSHNSGNNAAIAIPRSRKRASTSKATPAPTTQLSENPVPTKSILMKRSADGTFKIRRESQEQEEPVCSAKKKRVQFCLDGSNSVTVHTELEKNHRKHIPSSVKTIMPDPLEVSHDHQQVNHFEVVKEAGLASKFHCNCGSSFVYKKLLNRHVTAKQNGKVFNCLMCSKTFVLHESLKRHVRKSHRVQYHGGRFGCRVCGQTFVVYRLLREHQITHHHHHKRHMSSQGISQ